MRFIIKSRGSIDLDKAVEELYKRIPAPQANVKVKGDRIEITLRGVPRAPGKVRGAVLQAFAGPTGLSKSDVRFYDAGSSLRSEVLVDVLRSLTYDSRAEGRSVVTRAPPDLVNMILDRIKMLERKTLNIDGLQLSASVRKAVIAVSASTGEDPRALLRIGLGAGLLAMDGKKVIALRPWKEVAASLRRQVRLERGGPENKEGSA